jgi:hypothetical protein
MAMQPTVSQLTLTSSYEPQFSYTSEHTCTQIFLPTDRPTDRQAALFLQTQIFTQLFGCCCHPLTTKNQTPTTSSLPSFLPSSSEPLSLSLSLSLSRLPKLILSPLPKIPSLKTGGTSPNLNQLKNASSLLHRHSTRRKQRTSLTLWDLRIHRQPSVGAIYERFVVPTTAAALILRRSDRLFSPRIHSTCGFRVTGLLCQADGRYANQLQTEANSLLSSLRCFCPPSFGKTVREAAIIEKKALPAGQGWMNHPPFQTPTVDERPPLIHPTSRPHRKSHSSGESTASRQGATLIHARVDECGWMTVDSRRCGLVDRTKTTSLGRRQNVGPTENECFLSWPLGVSFAS